jgi:hypothetical protein
MGTEEEVNLSVIPGRPKGEPGISIRKTTSGFRVCALGASRNDEQGQLNP